jgi:hypothetical protein
MNRSRWIFGSVILGVVLIFGFGNLGLHAKEAFESKLLAPNKIVVEECGACHIAYPAKLLPKESWRKIMTNLENHFDENAEVDKKTNTVIKTYLEKHAADSNMMSRFNNILKKTPKRITLRITELPYFIRKHDEIPQSMVKNNPKVGSFSQCEKCHRDAQRSDFDEDRVSIPGYGNWED